jgi:predicted acyltransferase (DUF342 family)
VKPSLLAEVKEVIYSLTPDIVNKWSLSYLYILKHNLFVDDRWIVSGLVHKKEEKIDSMWTEVQGEPELIWLSHSAGQHAFGLR